MDNNKKIRVLLVEDHPLYRVGIRMLLEYSGLDCIVEAETENVEKTLAFLEQHGSDIDLILLDFYLPDGSGCDVIEAKKRYYEAETPIRVFPNPCDAFLLVEGLEQCDLTLFNALGQAVLNLKHCVGNQRLDFSAFANGEYLLQIDSPKGRIVKKVMKR